MSETQSTPFAESNALLAVIRDDDETVEEILRDMLPGELKELAQACDLLASMCRSERRRRL